MAVLKIMQRNSGAAPRALLALLLLTASFVLPPCTMAQSDTAAEHHCPHCPPGDTEHQMPGDAAVAPACDALDQLTNDGRSGRDFVKDIPVAVLPWAPPRPADRSRWRHFKPVLATHHPGAPPLNLLHCVNLN